jgi:hypothetical protein
MSLALVCLLHARACNIHRSRHHASAMACKMNAPTPTDCLCALRIAAVELLALASKEAGGEPSQQQARDIELLQRFIRHADQQLQTRTRLSRLL